MIYYNHILHKVMALLLIVSTALCLCLFTGCNKEKLPETGKYNTMIVLGGDGTKALDPEEVRSIVIYAFASGSDNLVGYLYEEPIYGQDTFPMNLTAGGYIDFYVILNPTKCDGFEIIDDSEHPVDFSSREGLTPETIQNWKLRRTTDKPGNAVPMSNLEPDRTFEVVANRNSWQEIPIQVTRAVSKMEVWFWANDNLPEDERYNYEHYFTAINEMALKDPVSSTEVFRPQGTDGNDYIAADEPFSATDDTFHNGLYERFKPYTTGGFYTDSYFRLIWEQYILPNTFFGGGWNGEPATSNGDYTTLSVSYTHYYSYAVDKGWQAATSKDKVISLPKSPRNTKIIVWCQLHDNTDRSFTYEVVDWDETVTMDVPAFN